MSSLKIVALATVGLTLLLAGCVHRRLTVKSDPPGALCRMENLEFGRTPVTVSFNYYGVRTISLEKDGYVRLVKDVPVVAPWYETFPLDFFAEVLYPGHIYDEHEVQFTLERRQPYSRSDAERLIERGREMRSTARQAIDSDPGLIQMKKEEQAEKQTATRPAPKAAGQPASRPVNKQK
jgi:hypothetical protein